MVFSDSQHVTYESITMSLLEFYPKIFSENVIISLKKKDIRTVVDFLQKSSEDITKILEIPISDTLLLREKVVSVLRKKPSTALDLLKEGCRSSFTLPTGIPEIDQLVGELKSGRIYEICGLSGSGKTQICLGIATHASSIEKKVFFIDTKNDFSASRVFKILKRKYDKDINLEMERIQVVKAFSLYKLVDVLHWLQDTIKPCSISLIIIDCISTCYFSHVGDDDPIGYAILNHIASLIKYIATQHHCVFILTNLATKSFYSVDDMKAGSEKSMKPCMGSYWQQISNFRLDLRKKDHYIVAVSLGRSDDCVNNNTYHVNLSSI